jgi:hypothetical protein
MIRVASWTLQLVFNLFPMGNIIAPIFFLSSVKVRLALLMKTVYRDKIPFLIFSLGMNLL